jgi:hypothetical protein
MNTTTLPRTLAAAAIALAAVTLSGCSLLVSALTGGGDAVHSLTVGDCIDGASGEGIVEDVPVVDCATLHEEEVFLVAKLDLSKYPGDDLLSTQASAICMNAYADFVGLAYEDSLLDYWFFYPSEDSYALGDRQVVCTMSKFDDNGDVVRVTGTLEGARE